MLPDGYVPLDACFAVKREGPWAGATIWRLHCVVGMLDTQGFAQRLRSSALRQGWRECSRAWLFQREGLAMSLEIERQSGAPTPTRTNSDDRVREVSVLVVQRASSGSCG